MPMVVPPVAYTDGAAQPPLWAQPDPALAAAGIEGEFVVARVRVLALALLLIAPTWNIVRQPRNPIHITGFVVTVTAAFAAVAIWQALKRGRWRPWIGFASSALDVSLVTTALVTFLVVGSPLIALNSTVTFEMYFLALVATSLRYDARICILVGMLAVSQYATLWGYSALRFDLHDPAYAVEAGPYSPVDLFTRLILLAVATLLAVTIVRRAQRLLYLAARDRLTGLFNRGHFDRALADAMDRADRDEIPLSLAIVDVDHFKRINDLFGHAVGDRTLVEVARRLERAMRRTDLVARYGGEEFVILMPGTTPAAAFLRVDSLRRDLAATPIDLGGNEKLLVNFSAGLAGTPDDADATTPKELLLRADERLLQAKRAGRARCIGPEPRGDSVESLVAS